MTVPSGRRIVVDRDITGANRLLAGFGELLPVVGRELAPAALTDAEILLVRSVTPVGGPLLAGSSIRFVGTATAGIDHVDLAYLEQCGITFAAAPGCNARAVGEHVLACVCALFPETDEVANLTAGIVGYGHTGQATTALLNAVGIRCVICDPFRAEQFDDVAYVSLTEALAQDIVTVHVPLEPGGRHPTAGLIAADELDCLRPGGVLINAARGGVVDEDALLERLRRGGAPRVALDCWTGEPRVRPALLEAVDLATPHVAGHSVDARLAATGQLARALAVFLSCEAPVLRTADEPRTAIAPAAHDDSGVIRECIQACNDVVGRTARMRTLAALAPAAAGRAFDELRREFGRRREFHRYTVAGAVMAPDTAATLAALGFVLDGE